jgi:hypothetical protein
MRRYYFYCLIEGDLMILAGISRLLKEKNQKNVCHLILPEHPRTAGGKMSQYYEYFDVIVCLPYEALGPSWRSTFKFPGIAGRFEKILKKEVAPRSGDSIFMMDVFKFQDLQVLNYFARSGVQINIVSAFVGEQFDCRKLQLLWLPTLQFSFYSLFYGGGRILTYSKRRESKMTGYYRLMAQVDNIFTIENAQPILSAGNGGMHRSLPYPVLFLGKAGSHCEVGGAAHCPKPAERRNVLMLVSTVHSKRWSNYWNNIRRILDSVDFNSSTLYVKDHPGVESEAGVHLSGYDFQLINNRINAERLYFDPVYDIGIVLGYGSTSLITATWLGIKAIDYTPLMNYPEKDVEYYSDFLSLGKGIVHAGSYGALQESLRSSTGTQLPDYVKMSQLWYDEFEKAGVL